LKKSGIEAPPKAIQVALRKATETLAAELARPSDVSPHWSEFEWLIARAAAAIHGISPLLSSRLRWQGPDGWTRFLEEQWQHTAARQARIEQLLRLIDSRARNEGLPVIALKGAALHAMGVYKAGERPMADLDLLVRENEAARFSQVLKSLGFHESWTSWKHRVFSAEENRATDGLGEHSEASIKIELHERICEVLPLKITDISDCIFPTDLQPGLNAYPSKAALMTHLLVHAAGAMAYRRLRLLNLHDISLLSACMSDADWDEVLGGTAHAQTRWWALPPLKLTARYYASAIPQRVLASLEPHCPWLLNQTYRRRLLTDVSLSYIWVEAFPGIEWAQSASEAVNYAVSRIRPDKETLAMRAALAKESWASGDSWSRLSHTKRMLRCATLRVTRAGSMYPVRVALGQPH
jgi:Uncharacterised nucleotidyltransferase